MEDGARGQRTRASLPPDDVRVVLRDLGTVRIFTGSEWVDCSAGAFVHVPEGGIHGFRNESGEPATILIHFAPGAPREAYFEGIPGMATATDEERDEFYRIHDNHWV